MASFELGKEIEKDVFRLVTSVGQRKNSESPKNIFLDINRFCDISFIAPCYLTLFSTQFLLFKI